jgi:hypothetical protein
MKKAALILSVTVIVGWSLVGFFCGTLWGYSECERVHSAPPHPNDTLSFRNEQPH